MQNFHETVSALKRPKLLIRTARMGLAQYRRAVYLRDIGISGKARGATLINLLLEREAALEAARKARAFDYSPRAHVTVLTALLAEVPHPQKTRAAA